MEETRDDNEQDDNDRQDGMNLSHEPLHLYRALLAASTGLVQGGTPEAVLVSMCDALVASSTHICLAWMYIGDPDNEVICPSYSTGRAREYTRGLVIDLSPVAMQGPARRSLAMNRPVVVRVRDDASFAPWREHAQQYGMREALTLPVGDPYHSPRGLVVIFVDVEDYFDRVGMAPFTVFSQLVTVALEQTRLKMSLETLASVDPLTGALNRRAMQEVLLTVHAYARRSNEPFSVLLLDLDRFKMINDNYGHDLGDTLLRDVADVAKRTLRSSDWFCRWGGEEFLIVLPDTDQAGALTVAEQIRQAVADIGVAFHNQRIKTTVSIGVACCPQDGDKPEFLARLADAALYEAKKSGRNCVVSARNARTIYSIAAKLQEAVESGRLHAAYQPIVQLSTGKQVAEEALARMLDEQGQVTVAADFIETAIEMQLTHLIDHAVISQTIHRCTSNLQGGIEPLAHFVNVSAGLLSHPDLTAALFAQAQEACGQCAPDLLASTKPLVLEINEKQVFGDIEAIKMKLLPFVGFGIRLAINGFGGGCSSFRYLANLPISFIKIDGELVRRVRDKRIRSIIKRICDISGDLDLVTIAQFVEDTDTLDILRELGVDWGQGYLFGRPVLPGS